MRTPAAASLAAASLAALALLTACATPSQRIAAKLTDYGVPAREAQCMGDRLQSRLSVSELKRLNDISRIAEDRRGRMTVADIARTFNSPQDAGLAVELVRAGIGCAI